MHPAVWPQQKWAENWEEGSAPFWKGGWVSIKHNVIWAEAYFHTKWHLDPCSHLATTDMGRKLRGCALLGEGEVGPNLTQCVRG